MRKWHYGVIVVVAILLFFTYYYLLKSGGDNTSKDHLELPQLSTEVGEGERLVEMETSMGVIKIKLFEAIAPKTVENFITHSENGYYEGITFHRVMKDMAIQGGDPLGTGAGGESIYSDYFEDEFSDQLYHLRGAVAMVNFGTKNTNGSQFSIVQRNSLDESQVKDMEKLRYPTKIIDAYRTSGGTPWLDKSHTIFGQVIEGMEVVDEIANVEVDSKGKPVEAVIIEKIKVVK